MPLRPEAVILDYGCVLSRPQRLLAVQAMAQRLGVPVPAFEAAYWQHRAPYDGGLSAERYWARVASTLDVAPERGSAAVPDLIRHDVDSWSDLREEMWTLAAAVRSAGMRLALLSNCTAELLVRLQTEHRLASRFDVVIASCEAGVVKPERRIYEICLARLGMPAAATLFVDDREDNLRAARAVGIRTLHFTGDESIAPLRAAIFGADARS
jgi:putative hydrolase of the HAD superfamily